MSYVVQVRVEFLKVTKIGYVAMDKSKYLPCDTIGEAHIFDKINDDILCAIDEDLDHRKIHMMNVKLEPRAILVV